MSYSRADRLTNMYMRFLRDCFLELSPEAQADFWMHVGNYRNARNPVQAPHEIEYDFGGK